MNIDNRLDNKKETMSGLSKKSRVIDNDLIKNLLINIDLLINIEVVQVKIKKYQFDAGQLLNCLVSTVISIKQCQEKEQFKRNN